MLINLRRGLYCSMHDAGYSVPEESGNQLVNPVPDAIMQMVEARKPLEDREPHERIFPAATRSAFANALERACKFGGVPVVSPHDIRHRYISLLVMAGTPITLVQEVVGHSKASMTLDTYSHTMMDETSDTLRERREVVERRGGGVTGGVTDTPAGNEEGPAIGEAFINDGRYWARSSSVAHLLGRIWGDFSPLLQGVLTPQDPDENSLTATEIDSALGRIRHTIGAWLNAPAEDPCDDGHKGGQGHR